MIQLVFSVLIVFFALMAAFARSTRLGILSLWMVGLFTGALFLTVGAELLAITQWVLSTVVTISFVFFSVMFGEYKSHGAERKKAEHSPLRGGTLFAGAIAVGFAFALIQWFGLPPGSLPAEVGPVAGNDLLALGQRLVKEHFIALQVLSLMLFLVLVGTGVIASPDQQKGPKGPSAGGAR